MIPVRDLLFAGAALLMVLTPGPNMIYLISRSICQGGRRAGIMDGLNHSSWMTLQRCVIGSVLGGLAVRMALDLRTN
jgi:threonine/homoserine/homoserine lactone efflux protein